MMDIYMILILSGMFGIFVAFLAWCSQIVDKAGGESK